MTPLTLTRLNTFCKLAILAEISSILILSGVSSIKYFSNFGMNPAVIPMFLGAVGWMHVVMIGIFLEGDDC